MKTERLREQYERELQNRFELLEEEELSIEEVWTQINGVVAEIVRDVLGSMPTCQRNCWLNEECKRVAENRRRMRERFASGNDPVALKIFRKTRRKVKRCTRTKKEALRITLEEINRDR